ncbi:MAG: hypothetical protein JXB49_02705 [Bacteroidales bacterium]|nr:hypothetical protein [Bacteroidales bacterium]
MLVQEEGDVLHLIKSVPDWWLDPDQVIRFYKLPTNFGNIDLLIKGTANWVYVLLKGIDHNNPARK